VNLQALHTGNQRSCERKQTRLILLRSQEFSQSLREFHLYRVGVACAPRSCSVASACCGLREHPARQHRHAQVQTAKIKMIVSQMELFAPLASPQSPPSAGASVAAPPACRSIPPPFAVGIDCSICRQHPTQLALMENDTASICTGLPLVPV